VRTLTTICLIIPYIRAFSHSVKNGSGFSALPFSLYRFTPSLFSLLLLHNSTPFHRVHYAIPSQPVASCGGVSPSFGNHHQPTKPPPAPICAPIANSLWESIDNRINKMSDNEKKDEEKKLQDDKMEEDDGPSNLPLHQVRLSRRPADRVPHSSTSSSTQLEIFQV
ncbi:hypothetical protein PFISCL1PPCAC_16429, partial [Pristionchus fissidentatus]